MAAERYLSRRIPDSRVGNDIDKIDKKPILFMIHDFNYQVIFYTDLQNNPYMSMVILIFYSVSDSYKIMSMYSKSLVLKK